MKKVILVCTFSLVGWLGLLTGQVQDTLPPSQVPVFQQDTIPFDSTANTLPTSPALPDQDSVRLKKHRFLYRVFKQDYPNPNKALYISAAFPGGGQIYNKRWWKVPFVWGGYAYLVYVAGQNSQNYKLFRDAYLAELDGKQHVFSGTRLKANDLRRLRDQYDKRKQLSYIGIFGLHLVQAAEAFVDCHLKTFDVSDDLSLRLKPSFQATPTSGPTFGFGIALVVK